jgi:protocatechuate 3,4-dioxygenase beta subunit
LVEADRLREIVNRVTDDLRAAIVDLRITEEEWYPALDFLVDVGRQGEIILLSDVLRLSVTVNGVSHPEGSHTASSVVGPFWQESPSVRNPADLRSTDEAGEPLVVSGAVRSQDGERVIGAEVDLWQADDNGTYDVQLDRVPHLRGRQRTNDEGRYEFVTVVPPPYEVPKDGPVGRLLNKLGRHAFRPAHVHLKVNASGYRSLTTMVFLAGDPWLSDDVIGAVKAPLVVAIDRSESPARLQFDVVLTAEE